jgi:hypothetical protein
VSFGPYTVGLNFIRVLQAAADQTTAEYLHAALVNQVVASGITPSAANIASIVSQISLTPITITPAASQVQI